MEFRLHMIALLSSLGLLVLIFETVRRRHLQERYALLWLFTAATLVVLSLSKKLMDAIGHAMGIHYSPTAFFLLAFMFLLLITLQFSIIISKLSERNRILAQELALLKLRVQEVADALEHPPARTPRPSAGQRERGA